MSKKKQLKFSRRINKMMLSFKFVQMDKSTDKRYIMKWINRVELEGSEVDLLKLG